MGSFISRGWEIIMFLANILAAFKLDIGTMPVTQWFDTLSYPKVIFYVTLIGLIGSFFLEVWMLSKKVNKLKDKIEEIEVNYVSQFRKH